MANPLRFRHQVIDADPPGRLLDILLFADLTGNGLPDLIIGGKEGDANLFWYENPGWQRHVMAHSPQLEAGGVVVDLNRDSRPDVVVGQQGSGRELYWFECPPDPREPWTRHLITDRFQKYHDQAVGDVDGDGEPELLFASQNAGVLAYYDLPDDPTVTPWPDDHLHLIADDVPNVEGLVIADIDGDGRNEVLAGPNVYRLHDGRWQRQALAPDYTMTRVALLDLEGDGRPTIVLAEGESNPARLALLRPPDYQPELLRDDLYHPHSLDVADFDGDGLPDLFVGEMGLGGHPNPRLFIYRNDGRGGLMEVEIDRGKPVHEAKAIDLDGDGRPDIAGKPYSPECHVDLWLNETEPIP